MGSNSIAIKNKTTHTTFNCELCGKERTEKNCWYKKQTSHYCSRECANKANAQKKSTGLTRKEYEKIYWSIPENAERGKINNRKAYLKRVGRLDDAFKKVMLNLAKRRAKRKNIEFSLTVDDIYLPSHCPILGIPLVLGIKQGGSPNSFSLDRIDNKLGYVKGNVQVISKRANSIKSDASLDEILLLAKWAKEFLHS